MTDLYSPMTYALFAVPFLIGILSSRLKRHGSLLPFVGGICTAVGIIMAFLSGSSMQVILIYVLGIQLASSLGVNGWEVGGK